MPHSEHVHRAPEGPEDLIGTMTSSVACLACEKGTIVSWRADEPIHPAAKLALDQFRMTHFKHNDMAESGAVGTHYAVDTFPPRITILNTVTVTEDPLKPDHLLIGGFGPSTHFAQ